jgi:tape measure domain-containing protein
MSTFNIDGQDALNTIRTLIAEVNNLKIAIKSISTSNTSSFSELDANYNKLKVKVGELSNKLNYLNAILKTQVSGTNTNTSATATNTKITDLNTKSKKLNADAANKSTKANKSNSASSNTLSGHIKLLNGSLSTLFRLFGLVSGVSLFFNIAKDVFETIKTFDALEFALEKVIKGIDAAAQSQTFLTEISNNFGTNLIQTTNRWIKFRTAAEQSGLTLLQTEKIFRSVTKAAGVLGLKTDELTGIYLALEQMLSKGKVTTEELRRQLGERLPGAFGIMAAAIGVNITQLDAMLKKGQVLSADVLPKFAVALESAYGIETINRVDTLVAAQTRVTTAWQLFVKNVFADSTGLQTIFNNLAGYINDITKALSSPKNLREILIGEEQEEFREKLNKRSKEELELIDRRNILIAAKQSTYDKKEIDAWQKKIDEIDKMLGDAAIARDERNKAQAAKELLALETQLSDAKNEFERLKIGAEQVTENKIPRSTLLPTAPISTPIQLLTKSKKTSFEDIFGPAIKDQEAFQENLDIAEGTIIQLTAQIREYRLLLEEPSTPLVDTDNLDTAQINLRNIKDLTLELQNEILKNSIDVNEKIINNDKSSIEERRQALIEMYQSENALAENQLKIKIRDINQVFDAEQKSLKKSVEEGKLSKEKYDAFYIEAEEEKNQKIELASTELAKKLAEISETNLKINFQISTDEDNIGIDKIQDEYNQRIIKIKEYHDLTIKLNNAILNNDKSTNKEKAGARKNIDSSLKRSEEELKDVSIEMANAVIDAKIQVLKATIAGKNADDEWVKQVIRNINDLEAAKKEIKVNPPKNNNEWVEYFNQISDLASDLSRSLGDLFDGIYESRIENINAEIEAEKEKYDNLIDLAEGEELQQKILRRNKEKDIKALEKKRLKEEQKQARARKLFAISDVAISTAQAIVAAYAPPPVGAGPLTGSILAAIVGAIGALQIAAILAQPIPKYKEGESNIKKEHFGMINDGIFQEYVERKGKILTTERKNAIVKLQPGDTIYKNYKEMSEKSSVINAMTYSNRVSKERYLDSFINFEDAIINGFKKAKVNNNIQLVGFNNEYQSYKDSILNWSKK